MAKDRLSLMEFTVKHEESMLHSFMGPDTKHTVLRSFARVTVRGPYDISVYTDYDFDFMCLEHIFELAFGDEC